MAFSQIFHHEQGLGFAGSTTSSVNSTGAKLLIIKVAFIPANDTPDVSDSKGNTWIPLSIYQGGTGGGDGTAPGNVGVRFYYCISPTVGSGHTFTITKNFTYISVSVTGWSCPNTPVYDKSAGGGSTGVGSRATGSVTPAADNSLIISAVANDVNDTYTPDSSLSTIGSVNFAASNNRGITSGYVLQTTKTAINVTWSKSSGTANMAAAIAVFYDSADTPPAGAYSLTCSPGSFALTGQNVNLVKIGNQSVVCDTGTFALTGQNANLTKSGGGTLACGTGSFTLTGKDATLVRHVDSELDIWEFDIDYPVPIKHQKKVRIFKPRQGARQTRTDETVKREIEIKLDWYDHDEKQEILDFWNAHYPDINFLFHDKDRDEYFVAWITTDINEERRTPGHGGLALTIREV